ncbi:involucrin-like [Arachis ipaensis]|uniref:involucrin-like n=1 Tax=Arachis ipaensis TaxID=130454 RepID=UPI0007AF2844|nr:involucrin-like [Arachis ipaensis]
MYNESITLSVLPETQSSNGKKDGTETDKENLQWKEEINKTNNNCSPKQEIDDTTGQKEKEIVQSNEEAQENIVVLSYCILHGGEIDLAQLIADSIQEMAEDTNKSGRLGHPSTILRLCNRAGVLFEDEDTEKEVLDEISQQNAKAQEQYSRQQELHLQQQEQYLEHREQYSKDREQDEAWQHRMEERLGSWQQQSMAQQQELQAKVLEGQRELTTGLQESYDKMFLTQAKYGEYTHKLYQWKNVHHTIGETRQVQQIEHYEDTQAKLEYLIRCMPGLNSQIKPFELCQDLRDQQKAKTKHYTAMMYKRLETAGLTGLIDPIWDRRCPSEEVRDYSKLGKRKKNKGESSKSKRMEMPDK